MPQVQLEHLPINVLERISSSLTCKSAVLFASASKSLLRDLQGFTPGTEGFKQRLALVVSVQDSTCDAVFKELDSVYETLAPNRPVEEWKRLIADAPRGGNGWMFIWEDSLWSIHARADAIFIHYKMNKMNEVRSLLFEVVKQEDETTRLDVAPPSFNYEIDDFKEQLNDCHIMSIARLFCQLKTRMSCSSIHSSRPETPMYKILCDIFESV